MIHERLPREMDGHVRELRRLADRLDEICTTAAIELRRCAREVEDARDRVHLMGDLLQAVDSIGTDDEAIVRAFVSYMARKTSMQ